MKKIFYFIASAIVALGAVACQNEIDENIAPESTNDCTITVNIADTRVAIGEIDTENKKVPFGVEAGDILELTFSLTSQSWVAESYFVCQEGGLSFKPATTEDADKFNTYIEHEELSSIQFRLACASFNTNYDSTLGVDGVKFGVVYSGDSLTNFKENRSVTVQLLGAMLMMSCNETVTLTSSDNEDFFAYEGGYHNSLVVESTGGKVKYIAINYNSRNEYSLSYSINGVTVKSVKQTWKPNTIYNLGTLRAKSEWAIIGSFAASNWTDIAMYEDGNYAVAYNVTLANDNQVKFRKYDWDNAKQRTCVSAFTKNNITYFKNDGSDSPACGLDGTYDIYIPKANAGYAIVVEAGQPLPNTLDGTTISLIGGAVGGWDTTNDVVLTWNKETGLFSKENVTVSAGEIKLRANKSWDHSWGTGSAEWTATHEIWYNGANGTIAAGTYNISTDLKSVTVAAVSAQ